ncbi:MAG: Peptide deformylase [Parcubacteria group bacterium GW2011_GWE2_38_18]|nr:MAG: Peptide deformylase [Parcubacteria group bacterium GW2011_GWE2_38_18]
MSKIYPIIKNKNPILRKVSAEIAPAKYGSNQLKKLFVDMTATMYKKDGIGLAAPQISKSIRMVVINTTDGPICMINPVITKRSTTQELGEEGCLSVPGVFGQVNRYKSVDCQFIDENGQRNLIKANKMMARVIQHELDHLDGILFIDKLEPGSKTSGKTTERSIVKK